MRPLYVVTHAAEKQIQIKKQQGKFPDGMIVCAGEGWATTELGVRYSMEMFRDRMKSGYKRVFFDSHITSKNDTQKKFYMENELEDKYCLCGETNTTQTEDQPYGPIWTWKNHEKTGVYDLTTDFYTPNEPHPLAHMRTFDKKEAVKHASLETSLHIASIAYENVTPSIRLKSMQKTGLFILPSGADFDKLNDDMKRAVLMKIPQPVKEEPLTTEELLAKANTLIEEKVSKNVQRQYWKCLNPGCPVETEKKYKPVKDPENPTKKISFFKHHQKYCAFIPEDDLETKRKKEEACIRVAQGKKEKEAKKSEI